MNALCSAPMRRPRILVIGPGPSQVGGVATFTQTLLSSSLAQRYELIHLDTTRGPRGAGRACTLAGINVWYLTCQVLECIHLWFRLRPCLIHVPITSFISFWKGAAFLLMGRSLGMKTVAHLHGGMFIEFYRSRSGMSRWLIRRVLHLADVILALSPEWKNLLLEQIAPELNIEVVPNPVDAAFAELACQKTVRQNQDRLQILFLGTLSRHKGVFDVLEAVPHVLERFPDVRFVLAGVHVADVERTEIDKIIRQYDLDGAVSLPGLVRGQAKADLFQRSTLFVLPSYCENLPIAVLEAMAAGLPVVATSVGALPELIEPGANGFLIDPGDVQALADRIVRLLDDEPLRVRMGHANKERIRTSHLPQEAVSRIDSIYSRLVDLVRDEVSRTKGSLISEN